MQWSDEPNAGFSDADPDDLVAPVVDEGRFGYERVNVEAQEVDPDSLFNWVQRLVHTRKENPEFGWGKFDLVETETPGVVVHRCASERNAVVAIHNLSGESVDVSFELAGTPKLVDVFENRRYDPAAEGAYEFEVDPYGYRWLRVGGAVDEADGEWERFEK